MDKKQIKEEYEKRKKEIKNKLKSLVKPKTKREIFLELCYCLLVPLSRASKVYEFLEKNKSSVYLPEKKLAKALRGVCRFHNIKAKYIVEARKKLKLIDKIPNDPKEAREFLVRNFKGLGYKEASHFLRNIGYRGLSILDRHILNCLYELGLIKNKIWKSKKEYLEIEEKMKKLSKELNISLDELDFLLWSIKTGNILK
ncbi:MAG: N-glycosylase/DNA lyase [Candidatus Micrarchaeia archaeon]